MTSCLIQYVLHTHFRVCVTLIVEDPTVTVKCRTARKALCLYFNVCLSVMLDSLSCSFTPMSFIDHTVTVKCRTARKALCLYFNLCISVMLISLSSSFTSISFITKHTREFHPCPSLSVLHQPLSVFSFVFLDVQLVNIKSRR